MASIDDLNAAVAALQSEASALTEAQTATLTALTDLLAEVQSLQAAVAAGDSAAVETAAQNITAVTSTLQGIASSLSSAAAADDPGAPPAPAPDPAPAQTATQAFDPATSLPLYQFTGGSDSIDTTEWTEVTDVTGPNSTPLYTFSGDTANGTPTGTSADWTPFTGTPTPVG
jgi:hypothetical protein